LSAANETLLVEHNNDENEPGVLSGSSINKQKLNTQKVNKRKVALGFDKAAWQYNSLATIQDEIAGYGIDILQNMNVNKAENLLDIGCGTARSFTQLNNFAAQILGIDISFNMLQQALLNNTAKKSTSFTVINGDAESLPVHSCSIATVYSSMALQWCQSPKQALAEVYRVLKPSGKALLCILTGESFTELQRGWHHIGLPSRINMFHSSQSWIDAADGFNCQLKTFTKEFVSQHKNVLSMLRSIKQIGANTKILIAPNSETLDKSNKVSHHIGKKELSDLSFYLENQNKVGEAFTLTYHVLFLEISK